MGAAAVGDVMRVWLITAEANSIRHADSPDGLHFVNAVRLAGCFIICWARVWGSGARWLHGPQAPAPWKGANSAQHQSGVTRDCGSPCELEAEFFPERFLDLCFGSRVVRLVQV